MKHLRLQIVSIFALFLVAIPSGIQAQNLPTSISTNNNLPDLEPSVYNYNFGYPILSDVLTNPPVIPSYTNRYQMSLFGPRYKTTSGSNVTTYDFHQGEDFTGEFTYNGISYTNDTMLILPDSSNLPRLLCMCDGVVDEIITGTDQEMEAVETGRSVRIRCNENFQGNHNPAWGSVYIAYRHMSKVLVTAGSTVTKGDTLGWMGRSGYTDNIHLHLSVQRKEGSSYENVHPMRLFDPMATTHLHKPLQEVYIEHLCDWEDSSLFRISIPRTQMSIKRIELNYDTLLTRVFDFESVSMDADRDNRNIIPGMSIFAYNFNRASTQYNRYVSTAPNMAAFYPASPNRPANQGIFPISDAAPFNDPQIVASFDVIFRGLPANYDYNKIRIAVSDIYGNEAQNSNYTGGAGQNELNQLNLALYPNPTGDEVQITGKFNDAELLILDNTGKLVMKKEHLNAGEKLSVADLSPGAYTFRISNGKQHDVLPFIRK